MLDNNNPGNLRPLPSGKQWHGQTGVNSSNFVIFDTIHDGLRAMAVNLAHSLATGYNTLNKLIGKYDPGNTAAYVQTVSEATGWDPDEILPLDMDTLANLMDNMIIVEIGADRAATISEDDVDLAIEDAEQTHPNLYTATGATQPQPAQAAQPQQNKPATTTVPPPKPAVPATQASVLPGLLPGSFKLPTLPTWATAAGLEWWEIGIAAALVLVFVKTRYYD